MAVTRLLIDTAPVDFPFLSKKSESNVLFSSSDRQDSKQVPNWIENYWQLPDDNIGTIIAVSGFIDELPSDIISRIQTETVQSHIVQARERQSVLIVTRSSWSTFTSNGWFTHFTFSDAKETSVTILKGITYIMTDSFDLYTYSEPGTGEVEFQNLEVVATVGLDFTKIISLCTAVSYLIATDGETIFWSSPLNPIYWTPDGVGDDAGAGATKILAVRGEILFLQGTADGFYVFTNTNVIFARYTEIAGNPWSFEEVLNSSGVFFRKTVSSNNSGTVFAWADHGLGAMTAAETKYIFPGLTELLAGNVFETFNKSTNVIDSTFDNEIDFDVYFLTSRYLIVSYGLIEAPRQFLLMYDTLGQKWTRIAIDHVSVLDLREQLVLDGLIFDRWLISFDDSLFSFESMLSNRSASNVQSLSLTILTTDGVFKELSAVDINTLPGDDTFFDEVFEILDNVISFSDVKLTRNRDVELSEVSIFYRYPSFPDKDNPLTTSNIDYSTTDTEIVAFSRENPSQVSYLLSSAADNEEFYTERVKGSRITLVIKNTSSIQGVELGLISAGRRR